MVIVKNFWKLTVTVFKKFIVFFHKYAIRLGGRTSKKKDILYYISLKSYKTTSHYYFKLGIDLILQLINEQHKF